MTLKGHTNRVIWVAYTRSGKTLASTSSDGTTRFWDTATGKEKAVLKGHTGEVQRLVFSPVGMGWQRRATTERSGSGNWSNKLLSRLLNHQTLDRLLIKRESRLNEGAVVFDLDVRQFNRFAVKHDSGVLRNRQGLLFRVVAACHSGCDRDRSLCRIRTLEHSPHRRPFRAD